MATALSFTEHLIADGFNYSFGISTVDLTGNGLLDLIAVDTDVGLYWYENLGNLQFCKHVIHRQAGQWLERHQIADINGDGRPELIVVDNLNGSIYSFEFASDPRQADAWLMRPICVGSLPGAYDVAIADFSGNGSLDVAASSWERGNRLVWFENDDGRWNAHLIEDQLAETRMVQVVVNPRTGRSDLVATASGGDQIIWYENPGTLPAGNWIKHLVATPRRPIHGHAVDIDGDGDIDVVMAVGMVRPERNDADIRHGVLWFENLGEDGSGPWREHVITDDLPYAFEAIAVDLDGDGHLEVLATAWGTPGGLTLFKHDGDPRGSWHAQTLRSPWPNANQVIAADLDGTGRPDIIAGAERGSNDLRCWRHAGG